MTLCAYIRVSTDMQTTENQKFEIERWCEQRGWPRVEKWVSEDGVSGAKDYKKRKLGQLMDELQTGDTLIASEISRFGRDLMMVMEILRFLMDHKIKVYTVKDNFVLSDEIQCKVIAFAFGLAAEIERRLIQQRTKAALDRLRAEGKKLGRPVGSGDTYRALKGKEEDVLKMLSEGTPSGEVCRAVGINRATLLRFLHVTGHDEYIAPPPRKVDLTPALVQDLADKGYSFARAARTLLVNASTLRLFAKRNGIEFHAGCDRAPESVYAELDEKKDEIVRRRARGESMIAIRKSLGITGSTWSIWLKRAGLSEIGNIEGAMERAVEIQTLLTNGLSIRQIAIALHIKRSLVERVATGMTPEKRVYLRDLTEAQRALARQNGISDRALCHRLAIGWPVVEAISTPIIPRNRRHI
jgi:DNA invertase Pin-like site-specific DNA recombinase